MDRRSFLKIMGGIATLPVLGKFIKIPKKAATGVSQFMKDQGMPDFFYDLVAGVKKFGKKKQSSRDYDVYEFTDPKTKRKVEVVDGRDEVGISFETDKGFKGEMGVKKGVPDEMTKGKTPPDEYYEGEEVYKSIGGDGYIKDFEEGISGGYQGLEELAKRIGKKSGGAVGMPPIPQTEIPLYFNNMTGTEIGIANSGGIGIEGIMGNFRMGVGKPITGPGNLGDTGAFLEYRRQFADGGVSSGPPPRKGPNSQGIETLFQTR